MIARNVFSLLLRVVRSRLFRNLLFWVIIVYTTLNNTAERHKYPDHYYYPFVALTTAILVGMTYANNLWLVPRFLIRRRYWVYFPAAFILTAAASLAYTLAIKDALTRFPVMEIQQVAMIHSPVSGNWSSTAIFEDTQSYWGGLVLWLFVFTLAWYMNDYARQARIAREAQARQAELELSSLRSQLHPHFLFNTLNNLYGLASAKSEKAPDAILQLSDLLRYLLYDSSADRVSFRAETQAIQAYAALERLRLEGTVVCDIQTAGPPDVRLPPLLWLPVLENAYKHGTRFIGGPHAIHFRMETEEGTLRIECRNRCKSAPADEAPAREPGIGLTNLRKRLSILFPNHHQLGITSDGEWFNVLLSATFLPA